MNHDVTHYKGIGCPIKHGCLRYEAHTKAGESDMHKISRNSVL